MAETSEIRNQKSAPQESAPATLEACGTALEGSRKNLYAAFGAVGDAYALHEAQPSDAKAESQYAADRLLAGRNELLARYDALRARYESLRAAA